MDLLLNASPSKLPEKDYEIKRLTKELGSKVVFTLRALGYSRVLEIRRADDAEQNLKIVLAGTVLPDWKNQQLLDKHGAPTPAELVKLLLLPGEIDELAIRIEKLSGYRTDVTAEVKKN